MINYTCPYCGQDSYAKSSKKAGKYLSWKSVRTHTARCIKNNNTYTICEFYGPFTFSYIDSFESVNHFKKEYPNLSFESHFFSLNRKLGRLSLKEIEWSKDLILEKIQKYFSVYGKVPQHRQLDALVPDYPNRVTITRYFGSFNTAIEAAGFKPNVQNGFGTDTYAKDGILYRSTHEAYFVNNFLYGKYTYQYELPYGNGWYYDFYIKELNLYIELDGELRPQRIEEKRQYHKRNDINCRIIKANEIYSKNFKLE